jgi:hypothetical protein
MKQRIHGGARAGAVLTLVTGSDTGMGKSLLQWFIYLLVISLFVAYLACHGILPVRPIRGLLVAAALLVHTPQDTLISPFASARLAHDFQLLHRRIYDGGVFGWFRKPRAMPQ